MRSSTMAFAPGCQLNENSAGSSRVRNTGSSDAFMGTEEDAQADFALAIGPRLVRRPCESFGSAPI
jgi:hypothetical protein